MLARIEATPLGREPFHHLYVERVLPDALYARVEATMRTHKRAAHLQERRQDNAEYVNRRFSLVASRAPEIETLRAVFSDREVKLAFLRRFYVEPIAELERDLAIHEEFEFVYTEPGRFQNIHVDIPPKFMSFVFYLPDGAVTPEEEERNATVLYDDALRPHYAARFRANSVCVFVPHFHSYHGFSTTMERDVLVMFYVHRPLLEKWPEARKEDVPPFASLRDAIEWKLRTYPLIEYGADGARIARERERCRVNAPRGRVLRDGEEGFVSAAAGNAATRA